MKKGYEIFEKAERKRERSLFLKPCLFILKRKNSSRTTLKRCLRASLSLGDTSRLVGNFIEAERFYLDAKALAIKLRKSSIVTDSLVGAGLALRARRATKGALKYINKALQEFKKTKDAEGIAFATWALAGAYRIKGDIKGAVKRICRLGKTLPQTQRLLRRRIFAKRIGRSLKMRRKIR